MLLVFGNPIPENKKDFVTLGSTIQFFLYVGIPRKYPLRCLNPPSAQISIITNICLYFSGFLVFRVNGAQIKWVNNRHTHTHMHTHTLRPISETVASD